MCFPDGVDLTVAHRSGTSLSCSFSAVSTFLVFWLKVRECGGLNISHTMFHIIPAGP